MFLNVLLLPQLVYLSMIITENGKECSEFLNKYIQISGKHICTIENIFSSIIKNYYFSEQKTVSSDDEAACEVEEDPERSPILRTPIAELTGHGGVLAAADWLPGGDQVVTASWDRTAALYDVETGDLLQSLTGMDHN